MRRFLSVPVALVALVLAVAPSTALGAGEIASAAAASSASPAGPLPDLPHLPPILTPEPGPVAVKELAQLLDRVTSEDDRSRADARNALREVNPSIVPAIRRHVQDLRAGLDREAAPRVIEGARKAGRKTLHPSEGKASGKKEKEKDKDKDRKKDKARVDDDGDSDWLDFLLLTPHAGDKTWRDVVALVAMERMLAAVGTTPAVRELIAMHAYFGDLLRIDLQRQIAKLRDKAVPALIEARQHDAKLIQHWAGKQLEVLGRAIPGEAVASNDTQILADVLRAYGRTRDVDAVRVVLSYCNSERVQLREASREAIAAIGEPGVWQIRDQYLGLTGEKPPRAWTWDRLARELFALYDRARQAEIHKLMEEGLAAYKASNVVAAVEAFDKVLARAPLYEARKEMVPAYVDRAMAIEAAHHEDALVMMRKALRLDPKGERAKKIEAEIAFLEGVISVDARSPDKTAFQRAILLDPNHQGAHRELLALEDRAIEQQSFLKRYVAAGAIAVAALMALVLLAWRRPRALPTPAVAPPLPLSEPPAPPSVAPSSTSVTTPYAAPKPIEAPDDPPPAKMPPATDAS